MFDDVMRFPDVQRVGQTNAAEQPNRHRVKSLDLLPASALIDRDVLTCCVYVVSRLLVMTLM